MKRLLSVILALCMLVSVFYVSVEPATTEVFAASGLADNVQDGQILQCFNWSFTNMKNNMAKIAEQGFTAVQTSPIQGTKESTKESYSSVTNSWWVYYQPINFNIETNSYNALGTSKEFKEMCDEAEKYGIKVIVDAVLNHTANYNSGNTISPLVPDDIRNDSSCWHDITRDSWYESRWDITQFCMGGIPDLNTGNKKVQNYAISFLKECIDAGADGFRFDGAKHIEVPTDFDYASDFWPNVLNATTEYAKKTKGFTPYYYGEILDGPSGSNDHSNAQMTLNTYMSYMSVTQSTVSADIRNGVVYNNAAAAAKSDFYFSDGSCSIGTKTVLWNESHDNYMHGGTNSISTAQINKVWALTGSRRDAAGMYLARPQSMSSPLGSAGMTGWTYPEVKAINQFKNKYIGQSEYLSSSGSIAINERGTTGAVLVNCGGNNTSVNVKANMLTDGKYKDAITGNTFTVSGGKISGNIGSTGIAVITLEGSDNSSTPDLPTGEATIYFDNSSYNWSKVYAYVYNDYEENAAWPGVKMSLDSTSGYYKLHIDGTLAYGKVIFTESSSASTNRYPADGAQGLSINATNMIFSKGNSWKKYTPSASTPSGQEYIVNTSTKKVHLPTCRYATSSSTESYYGDLQALVNQGYTLCGTCKPAEAGGSSSEGSSSSTPALPTGKATIYFDNSSYNWSNIYAYVYVDGSENAEWPGVLMTLDLKTGYYKLDLEGVLAYGKVIFTQSKYATVNRYPADGAEGLSINGTNMIFSKGNSWKKYTASTSTPTGQEYIVNTSTKKVHLPSCRYATSSSTESYYGDLQTLVDNGYTLCGTCKPAEAGGSSSEESSSTAPALPTGKATIYFDNSSYNWSNIYAYVYVDDGSENAEWPGVLMTLDLKTGYYKLDLEGVLAYGKVIFTQSKYATVNRYPADGAEGLSINGTNMIFSKGNSWKKYTASTSTPTGQEYIVNTKTKKVHLPSCRYATSSSTESYYGDLQTLLDNGYTLCSTCKPDQSEEPSSSTPSKEPSSEVVTNGTEYIINTSTKKIHLPSCRYATGTSSNLKSYYGDIQTLLDQGYTLCGTCKPAEESSEEPSNEPSSDVVQGSTEYTLNTKTKKIHLPTCRHAKSSSNVKSYYGDLQALIEQGYTYCATCKPNKVSGTTSTPSVDSSSNPLVPTNSKYSVDGKLLFGVSEKTTASTVLSAFKSSDLVMYDADGNKVSGSTIVGTGYCIRYIKNGKIVDYLEIIVMGDTDGNGTVDSTDYLRVKQQWMNKITTTDVYEIAADVDRSGVIDTTDYLRIKSHFSGSYDLYA